MADVEIISTVLMGGGAVILVLFIMIINSVIPRRGLKQKQKQPMVPEIPGALPLIGHLHLLGANKPLCEILGAMADKHGGGVFAIRLGATNRAVVVSDSQAMRECFIQNDQSIAARPPSSQAKHMGYNFAAIAFADYGDYFRELKKMVVAELLSPQRVKAVKNVHVSAELDLVIKELYQRSCTGTTMTVDMSETLLNMVLNMMTRLVAGHRYFPAADEEENHRASSKNTTAGSRPISEVIHEFMLVAGRLLPSDFIPLLKWFAFFERGAVRDMKRVFKELDVILASWVDEHKQKQQHDNHELLNPDFLDVMLAKISEDDAARYGHERDTILKSTALALIMGGTDTTSITLTWVMTTLVNHKRVLKLAQEELDKNVGRERWVEDSDVENLPYIGAVIKETLRMYPAGPVCFPRMSIEDITISGYHVPKGTRILANFRKLHRDPTLWSDPDEFKPERFLTIDANYSNFEFLPFGFGRRGCPGNNLAMQVVYITIAKLLQGFDWRTPGDKPVDMTEGLGMAMPKETPLEVLLSPRLPSHLYV